MALTADRDDGRGTPVGGIVLASASPRRAELLAGAGVRFVAVSGTVAEGLRPGEAPADAVRRLARAKVEDVAPRAGGRFVVAADTVVVLDDEVFGKPRDPADAIRMLRRLSGRVHEVLTAFVVYDTETGRRIEDVVTTRVEFKRLGDDEIEVYVATGCPLDKAGAYGIQDRAAFMVRRIDGSYTNVVGLPLAEVVDALRRLGALPSGQG